MVIELPLHKSCRISSIQLGNIIAHCYSICKPSCGQEKIFFAARCLPTGGAPLDLFAIGSLTFEKGDPERFPALRLAGECLRAGGAACTVLNGANEAAVAAFLKEEIPFGAIAELVEGALEALPNLPANTLEEIFAADQAARRTVAVLLQRKKGAL